ncbi:hypothetical protein QYE76_021910 [Lolium multiflorum]|uniref:GH16 domain-containing protein n=1 Tax=Lolium multiflorum TaxID=4521 RepID=A0AAD8RBR3_LOLMU|nr:hypothetical protein QYE76_029552 [Lolium multiflorum]KAK1616393.1 hypothetical protein QYE76_021910 [Lolium multiflorum]
MALLLLAVAVAAVGLAGASFRDDCTIEWEPQNAAFSPDGQSLNMSLVSNSSGCLLRTKKQFIYGSVSTFIKLVPGNSAGTVTTYYTSSEGKYHDEIDFEFLGNETGQPYTLHTNVFANGTGNREMQFVPGWFDPTDGFHNYTISWTPCMIVWYVDGAAIRVFRNYQQSDGVPYPTTQPMRGYSSIWAAEDWATQGGRIKTDWSQAPFVAGYSDLVLDVCPCDGSEECVYGCAWLFSQGQEYCPGLDPQHHKEMLDLQSKYRIYNYCDDYRSGKVPGKECYLQQ